MRTDAVLILNLMLSLVIFALIARWYVMPRLARMPPDKALEPLLLLHAFRRLGMMFLASVSSCKGRSPRALPGSGASPHLRVHSP